MPRITITRALSEKKLLGKRLAQHMRKFAPLAVTLGDNVPPGFKSVHAFDEHAKSSLDQIQDELAHYDRLVQAIAEANAITKVTIAGKEYSVARALERKKFYSTVMADYLEQLKTYLTDQENRYESLNLEEKAKADAEFSTFIGRDKSAKEEEMKAARKIIDDRHKVHLLDPVNLRQVVEKLEQEQSDFLTNVDIVLTESNSRTEIEI